MTWHIWGAIRGALAKLRCPHCGEVQARGRGEPGQVIVCRRCRKAFRRREGEAPPRPRP